MKNKNPLVDDYIERAKPFAQPILNHLRKLVHAACPNIKEEIKWKVPYFLHTEMLCWMVAFQKHCSFGFWKGSLLKDPYFLFNRKLKSTIRQFGPIKRLEDLPSDDKILEYLKEAMHLNEEKVRSNASTF